MNCCFDTMIDCCQDLTTTSKEFMDAIQKTSGLTYGGMMKNKRINHTITKRQRKEKQSCKI